ncbi:alpha/beta-hydrolase [Stereum hirsutum FP-91666 SS1]|uniref:alpha/beta-hydrolase n=1 Tax=Stereum hirsutum (strain FP-91666) TaxID=721885 RepID=UPI0004449897|nr:alpha/beta-hydrolase [Stereum hirsutum FP-91666 SS1]EIM85929.1 alpha/beta-hydrolase [Stereum hirsutum FP-91666 SS1]
MTSTKEFNFKAGADVFTPKDLIELARPGTGLANPDGDLVLVPVSKYSFEDKKNNKSIYIAPLESTIQPLQIPLTHGGEAFWLDSKTVGHVVTNEGDKAASLYAISVKFTTEPDSQLTPEPPVLVGTFPTTSATNFRYSSSTGTLVFSDYVYDDGNLTKVKDNDEAYANRGNTAFVYDEGYERHWDTWTGPKKTSLFTVKLAVGKNEKWELGDEWVNALQGTGHHSPVEPFGGTDDFDISGHSIVYTAKDPKLPEASHTRQNIYLVDFSGGKPRELTSGEQGATHAPVFSRSGDKVAWTEMDEDGYEADRAKIVIYDLSKDVRFTLTQPWDRSPDALTFSEDDSFLYLTAADHARNKVFVLPVPATPSSSTKHPSLPPHYTHPRPLTSSGAASGLKVLKGGRLIYTLSSITGPNDVYIIRGLKDLEKGDLTSTWKSDPEQITKFTEKDLEGKDIIAPEEFTFEGAEGATVQGWTIKPKGFKEGAKKKWPVVLLIHGGPQGAWEDQWSTRWNPEVFAQQGYFTVAINPTGSTSFGQDFTDAIAENWGGRPFEDLQKGWKYILNKYPEIDQERAVAAGASWGGYAINWIQGHPEFGFGFKALVCHDGVFDALYNGYSTDELFFNIHEWGGVPHEPRARAIIEKYNPRNFVNHWSTPQLIIHGSKDFRLPDTEGIGAFHALKQRNVPARLVVFPDENHWVLNPGNSLKWHYEVFRWFHTYAGNDEE